ncbi:hypothetical protein Hamer_G019870 [Homarus americanus]|uniref:Uncharacterized protein n=1 Tax=Homarus americanus TaxID=6706 RepID=A0A8J5K330_HOMAM|nr:hypothetical protein Hamer_G019870 [Homarus americanus]
MAVKNKTLKHGVSGDVKKVLISGTRGSDSLVTTLEDLGNPFMEMSGDLLIIHTNDVMPQEVVSTVRNIQKLSQEQYDTFVAERLLSCNGPVTNTLLKNKLPRFSTPHPKSYGKLRPPSAKGDLVACLEKVVPNVYEAPDIDAVILNGPAMVNYLKPGEAKPFSDCACLKFLPLINYYLRTAYRLDLVWDTDEDVSLESSARARRGSGTRRRVTADAKVPSNRNIDFLRHSDNKLELFNFLTTKVPKGTYPSKEICVTHGQNVMSVPKRNDISNVAPCSQEEADTRISLPAKDSADRGYRKVLIKTVDSDAVALCIANIKR